MIIGRMSVIFMSLWNGVQISAAMHPQSFFKDHARGWFWYEDPEVETIEETEDPLWTLKEQTSKPKTATERLEDVQMHLKELKAKAILEPTLQNVKAYQEMQLRIVNQSQAFSEAWLLNVYQHQTLDENVRYPRDQGARFVVYENERLQTQQMIKNLKKSYGLFYFYAGACSYCKAFTPVIKQFANSYGWDVMAISLDGEASDHFKNWQMDNGIAKRWGVQTVPCVFAINPETGHVLPVAQGLTSLDEMEKRIVLLMKADTP